MGFFRRIWPKHNLGDKVAFSFTHFGLLGICFFELLIVLPKYHELFSKMYCLHIACGFFMLIQVVTNMYKLILTNSTVTSPYMNLPSVLRQGWYYCPFCQMNAPPRAHHCPVCDTCVIKRDHHCIFTGNCVGFYNHRYFVLFASYLWMGCVYVVTFNLDYYYEVLGSLGVGLIMKLVFPALAWTFGFVTVHQLIILVVAGVNFMAMFLFTCLMGFQLFFISRGQTQFECKNKVRDYSQSFGENWKLVLGSNWYLTWLSAYISSPLPGDGTSFKKNHLDMSPIHESVKEI